MILASLATFALSAAHLHENEERRAENLHAALRTRLIGQAEGILMQRERISADEAFLICGALPNISIANSERLPKT